MNCTAKLWGEIVQYAQWLARTEGHFVAATYLRNLDVPFGTAYHVLLGCRWY